MPISLDLTFAHADLKRTRDLERIKTYHDELHGNRETMNGWVDYPITVSDDLLKDMLQTAEDVRNRCTAFIVIGIGGSFLGAKAGFEMLISPFERRGTYGAPHFIFAGHHLSTSYYHELFRFIEDEDICLCVISKSGNTLEPTVIFSMLKQVMADKYGDEAASRIYVVTDPAHGELHDEAVREGYKLFPLPSNIGGRYSVLTPVGLFPMAVAGINITEIISGAKAAYHAFNEADARQNICYQYALARHYHARSGKTLEIFEVYEGRMQFFTEWLRQLFAESECKEGKGLFPTAMQMTTDLHSLGQFLQDGRQNYIETVISVVNIPETLYIPEGVAGSCDQLQCLNQIVRKGVCMAHQVNNTPNILLEVSELTPYTFGEMVYFFEKACAMSCYLTEVNPFDQPGVEHYKRHVNEALKVTEERNA